LIFFLQFYFIIFDFQTIEALFDDVGEAMDINFELTKVMR
jgi:hypothetical protein